MPYDLHQSLSEFSYGYGVTREIEDLLGGMGFRTIPYLPNLVHEGKQGFDAGFDRPGKALLIQFKLGHELKQFRRARGYGGKPANVGSPYYRFDVDISADEGQFGLLSKAQRDGAEVYYIAPVFKNWIEYSNAFLDEKILENSIIVMPNEILAAASSIAAEKNYESKHRVLYDSDGNWGICSEPVEMPHRSIREFITERFQPNFDKTISEQISEIYRGLDDQLKSEFRSSVPERDEEKKLREASASKRSENYSRMRSLGYSEIESQFLTLGFEAWIKGAQLLTVTNDMSDEDRAAIDGLVLS
ncbi:hypothetical protein [Fulvimarina sp. MAC3]|uniref:hypothetical protein n=1 Tax=Fulvimarina sp. MAC3 TaxID=3148887 RepID=UPI0031FC5E14